MFKTIYIRFIALLVVLLSTTTLSWAVATTDRISFQTVALTPGETETQYVTVVVIGSRIYTALNFDMKVPESIEPVFNNKGKIVAKRVETGILPKGKILTHIAVAEIPNYPKPLFFTDAAVIPYPTQEQRIEQVRVAAYACHALGIEEPKISLVHCSEKVSEKTFPFTVGYQEIIDLAKEGRFGKCIVDGPLDVKCSCSVQNMWAKGINSPINGEADALIFPDIEAGNSFYKTLTLFGRAETAGVLQGPMAPVVLPSRGDSVFSKYYSIALAAV